LNSEVGDVGTRRPVNAQKSGNLFEWLFCQRSVLIEQTSRMDLPIPPREALKISFTSCFYHLFFISEYVPAASSEGCEKLPGNALFVYL